MHIEGYLWLKTSDYSGAVALLESETKQSCLATTDLKVIRGDWRKYEFSLTASQTDSPARFAILFPGKGTIWIDQVSLIPVMQCLVMCAATSLKKVRALKPSFIRGRVEMSRKTIVGRGALAARRACHLVEPLWKNEPKLSDFAPMSSFCFLAVGAEPSITVNVEGRGATVEEAAAWVE